MLRLKLFIIIPLAAIGFFFANAASAALNFSISIAPQKGVIDQGQSVSFVATATANQGNTSSENIEFNIISGAPANTQISFSSNPCVPTCSAFVTVITDSGGTTPAGKYNLIMEGRGTVSTSVSTTTSYALTVSDPAQGAISNRFWSQTDDTAAQTGFNLAGNTRSGTAVAGSGSAAGVQLSPGSLAGTYTSAAFDTTQNSTYSNLTFSSTIPANYTQWTQTTDADFNGGTKTNTLVLGTGSVQLGAGDDFNSSTLNPAWTFSNPVGGTYSLAANPGHLQISVPAGSGHDCWTTVNCPTMLMNTSNTDAIYTTRIDGVNIGSSAQTYGIMLWQSNSNYLRFEYWADGPQVFVKAYGIINGVNVMGAWTPLVTTSGITLGASNYLKITRSGDNFSLQYGTNGTSWTSAGSFTQTLTVNKTGVYVINANTNPATTGNFDYFSVVYSATSGTYTSPIKQLPPNATVGAVSWNSSTPAGTSLAVDYRLCPVSCALEAWIPITNGASINQSANYFQYRATLATADQTAVPSLNDVTINVSYAPMTVDIRACSVSSCTTDNADANWTAWQAVGTSAISETKTIDISGISAIQSKRYVQYRASLTTLNSSQNPRLEDIRMDYEIHSNINFAMSIIPQNGQVMIGSSALTLSAASGQGLSASLTFGSTANPVAFWINPAYLPTGITAIPAKTSCPFDCSSDISFTAIATATSGTYVIPITATTTDGSGFIITKEAVFTLTVAEPFTYSLAWTNTAPCAGGTSCSTSIAQGANIPVRFDATKLTGASSEIVNFSVLGYLPTGVSVSFSYNSCAPTCPPAMTATVYTTLTGGAGDTPITTTSPYVITIVGTSASFPSGKTITLNLTVTAGFNFSFLFNNNNSASLATQTRTPNASVSPSPSLATKFISGTADRVSYSIFNPDPSHIIITPSTMGDCDFTAASPPQVCNGSFNIEIKPGIAEGIYIVKFTATAIASGNKKNASYALTVYPTFDFTLAWQDPPTSPVTMYQGDSIMRNIIITYNSPLPETVNFSATSPENGITAAVSTATTTGTGIVTLFVNAGSVRTNDFATSVTLTANAPAQAKTHSIKIDPLNIKIPPFDFNIMGWAWSDNIGWISFNAQNCDTNWNGQMDNGDYATTPPASANCPALNTIIPNYGAHLDFSTYEISGYAWSEHIGWITFEKSIAGPPPVAPFNGTETYMAKLNANVGSLEGWARAVSCPNAACDINSQWGWIKLSGVALNAANSPYGVNKNSINEFSGFAWGDKVLSWISFNSKNCDVDNNGWLDVACGGTNDLYGNAAYPYKVWIRGQLPNSPPTCDDPLPNVSFTDICKAPFAPNFTCVYRDKENDPPVQYTIKIYDYNNSCDTNHNTFIDISCGGQDDATTPITPIDTINESAQPDPNNPGKYLSKATMSPDPNRPGEKMAIITRTYGGNTTLDYARGYFFTITVQDAYHLE